MSSPALKMLFIIMDRSRVPSAFRLLSECGVLYKTATLCRGTASSEVLDLFGLGETEKALVCAIAEVGIIKKILPLLKTELMLERHGQGIAFTVPLAAVGGHRVFKYLSGIAEINGEGDEGQMAIGSEANSKDVNAMETTGSTAEVRKYDLIITIVNRGFAEEVMTAAKKAGARGGTIIIARGTKENEESDFFGVPIHPEKDLVLILASRETRHTIMQSICDGAGLDSEGRGITFALPVSDTAGIANVLKDDQLKQMLKQQPKDGEEKATKM